MSLLPRSLSEVHELIPRCKDADLIELRLDHFFQINFGDIRALTDRPLIVTLRVPDEGGFWQGSDEERSGLFQEAIDHGIDFIDVEYAHISDILPRLRLTGDTKLILSFHTKSSDVDDLLPVLREMFNTPADVYKLIYTARGLNDNLMLHPLVEFARKKGAKFIFHAMGEAGRNSRLLGALLGNAWTYTSLDNTGETAPGQITLQDARSGYHLDQKTSETGLIGLLGYPVAQSRGWLLHNLLIAGSRQSDLNEEKPGKDFLYLNFPAQDFDGFWKNWQDKIHGLSITIPHKEKVIPYLSGISPSVEASGVCNTAVKHGKHWWGFNTDLLAIQDLLQPYREKLAGGVLVIGTGATARSSIAALRQQNIKNIYVTGRNACRGNFLAGKYKATFIPSHEVDQLKIEVGAVIQTTPVGMYPNSAALPAGTELLREGMVALDVVYNPPLTRFLEKAQKMDCTVIPGEEMFIRQAAKQFELFSGLPVSVEEVRTAWQKIRKYGE
ncbi:MAG: type I 3-dehydroquinate dehydratase [Calditrichia bacterium]